MSCQVKLKGYMGYVHLTYTIDFTEEKLRLGEVISHLSAQR